MRTLRKAIRRRYNGRCRLGFYTASAGSFWNSVIYRLNLANHFRGRVSLTELAHLDTNTLNTLHKIMHEEQKKEKAAGGGTKEAEIIEDAIQGNL
jgi:hypothetical protein